MNQHNPSGYYPSTLNQDLARDIYRAGYVQAQREAELALNEAKYTFMVTVGVLSSALIIGFLTIIGCQ